MAAPTLYNNDIANSISWIVYINGLQVPVAGVSVQYGVWQMPQASITMVPEPSLHRLGAEDRVQTQVFYCDQWYRTPPQFCLMFDGEIVGWGFVGTTGSRAVSYNCVDYAQIFTQLFFFFMSSYNDIGVGAANTNLGIDAGTLQLAGYGALYPYSLFSQGLANPGSSDNEGAVISRPIDYVYNVIRALTKVQQPNRAVPAANFFTPWTKRTNMHRRWVALPLLDQDPGAAVGVSGVFPILRAVQSEQAIAAVSRMASDVGSGGSIWDMFGEILRTMMMEISMLPTPAAVQSDFATLLPKGPPSSRGPTFLASYFVKPQMFFSIPPRCNVFFPSIMKDYTYQEDYSTQPTRMYFNESALLPTINPNGPVEPGLQAILQSALTTAYPEEVDIASHDAASNPTQNGQNLLVYPEEYFKGPVILRKAMPKWFIYLLQAATAEIRPSDEEGGDGTGSPDHETAPNPNGTSAVPSNIPRSASELLAQGDGYFYDAYVRRAPNRPEGPPRPPPSGSRPGSPVPPSVWPLPPGTGFSNARYGGFLFSEPRPGGPHKGHDIMCPIGTPLYATVSGTPKYITVISSAQQALRQSARDPSKGTSFAIQDAHGALHYYMHMLAHPQIADPVTGALRDMKATDTITAGQYVGQAGSTGNSSNPHLHYQVTYQGWHHGFSTVLKALKAGRAAPPPPQAASVQQITTTFVATMQGATAPAQGPNSANPNGTNAGGVTQNTVTDPAAPTSAAAFSAGDTARNIFKRYAAYEYFKERYAKRMGGISGGAFNPYPVHGFGMAAFDRRSTAVDTFGYLMTIQHQLSPGAWGSSFSFSYGRTMQEAFALLQRQSALENARAGIDREAVVAAIQERPPAGPGAANLEARNRTTTVLSQVVIPEGGLMMAPTEPIDEIASVVQGLASANELYGALFYQQGSDSQDVLIEQQIAQQSAGAPGFVPTSPTADQTAANISGVNARLDTQIVASTGAVDTAEVREAQRLNRARLAASDILARAQNDVTNQANNGALSNGTNRRTTGNQLLPYVFNYPTIIELQPDDGSARYSIAASGTDGTTRARIISTVTRVLDLTATNEDVHFVRNAVEGAAPLLAEPNVNQSTNQSTTGPAQTFPVSPELEVILKAALIDAYSRPGLTNVRGDVSIHPTPAAEGLFASKEAALSYVGRPICTLDEYIDFLGPDGLREDPVYPNQASLTRDRQQHPAKFYGRIRRFRKGPPNLRPETNTGNTEAPAEAPSPETTRLTEEFLINMRAAMLSTGTQTATNTFLDMMRAAQRSGGPVPPEAFLASMRAAALRVTNPAAATAFVDRMSAGLASAETRAATETFLQQMSYAVNQPGTQLSTAEFLARMQPPAAATAPVAAVPAVVYRVQGLPRDFPDLRGDWDEALERYRIAVLTTLAPRN